VALAGKMGLRRDPGAGGLAAAGVCQEAVAMCPKNESGLKRPAKCRLGYAA
jgi:hypothetical protein